MPKRNRGYFLAWRPERGEWEIRWYVRGQRKRHSTGEADRDKAEEYKQEFENRQKRRAVSRLIDDVLDDYQNEHAPHVSKPSDIANCVLNLLTFFEDLSVDEVTKGKCQEYALLRKKQVSNATIRKDLEILRAALNHDKREGRIKDVPYVWMPDKGEAKDRWLTRKEVAALLRAARKQTFHLPWFILLSLYSGQRKQAVLNLTWDRVDLDKGLINWQYGKRTNKRRPRQPMPDELKMYLRYLSQYGTRGFVLHIDGRQIGDIKKSLSTALKQAGITKASSHTLKHTSITWMMQNGTPPWLVAGFTGTSLQTIMNTYGHHAPDYMEEARSSFKDARRRRLPRMQPQKKANVA